MPEKQLRRMNAHYALIQGLFWGGYATIWAFLTVLLLYRGFSNSQIGVVSFLALTLPIVVQPGLAALADQGRTFHQPAPGVDAGVSGGDRGGSDVGLGSQPPADGGAVCAHRRMPDGNAAIFQLHGYGVADGRGRPELRVGTRYRLGMLCGAGAALGSADGAVRSDAGGSGVCGAVCDTGPGGVAIPVSAGSQNGRERPQVLTNLQLLRKYPRFVLLLAACALLMACHSSSCTYMIHIVEKAGAGSGAMGAALALAAFLELPAMGLFSRMRQRLSLAWLLRLCAGAFLAKIVVFWLAESMTAIYLASVLQFFEYGIFTPATVYYVVEHIDRGNQVKGQALISVASSGVGSAFGSLCCGLILDRAGVSGMLLFEVACAAAGCVVMLLATGEGKRK